MIREVIISIVLIVLAVFALNPFDFWMPDMATMAASVALLVVFVVFSGLLWRERAADEREAVHQAAAGRFAYFVGVGMLVLGIAVQELEHALDPHLVATLVLMVLAKVVARAWKEWRG